MHEPYSRSVRVYDAVNDAEGKDYGRESEVVLDLIRTRVRNAVTLLDVACGTGRHLEHFARHLQCAGVDRDERMLEVARERCPAVPFTRADMTSFDLGTRFDAVVCLFSAIGYASSAELLDAAVRTMARHLAPGGVVVVEPWIQPEQWMNGYVSVTSVDRPDLKVARMSFSGRRDDVAVLDFHYLVGTQAGVDACIGAPRARPAHVG